MTDSYVSLVHSLLSDLSSRNPSRIHPSLLTTAKRTTELSPEGTDTSARELHVISNYEQLIGAEESHTSETRALIQWTLARQLDLRYWVRSYAGIRTFSFLTQLDTIIAEEDTSACLLGSPWMFNVGIRLLGIG